MVSKVILIMKRILVYSLLAIGLWPGTLLAQTVTTTAPCDSTFRVVDEMPVYKKGLEDFIRDVRKDAGFGGGPCRPDKITIKWVINTQGKNTQVEVEGLDGTCRENFIHQIELMSPWKPGKRKGKLVCVRMAMPIYITYSDSPDGY